MTRRSQPNQPSNPPSSGNPFNPFPKSVTHTCFFCRQTGQPVQPITATFNATALTPAGLADTIEVETFACTPALSADARVDGKRCLALSLPAPRHAVEYVQ